MTSLGKPVTQRQLRVGEMIKQALGMLFIRDEAKLPISTKEITVTEVRMNFHL
jgi:ribosome-binding factor A